MDDVQWLEETIKLLKNKEFNQLDWDNLIEELEDLGREKKNAVASLLEQVIRHLLFLQYWTSEYDYNAVHWQGEIYNFRIQLKRKLTTNLRNYLDNELSSIYNDALGFVTIKTQNSVSLPPECPYCLDQLLDIEWLPKE
ncbi:DUF29 domain-containing protein [Moorena producens]|uniref:DUF29 domain-containing protein n=1 Tax=Moorena producens TaxID=1155739 RepID=UPI0005CB5D8B|nr:DUF29 domain-containing protein [Moorena producens]OLT66704.1 hypothetical protein BI334_18340 [Moorena producens 3L]